MVRGNVDLRISLQEIRDLINVERINWTNIDSTNCYAFALGLDVPEDDIVEQAYIPGTISGSEMELWRYLDFDYKDLLINIYNDLDCLGIQYRDINPDEIVKDDEWKIALFTTPYWDRCSDFHFLRLFNDGIWHHKNGLKGIPTIYDDHKNIIINPLQCCLKYRKYNKCLSLKLK